MLLPYKNTFVAGSLSVRNKGSHDPSRFESYPSVFLYGTRLLRGHCNERGQVTWCAGSTVKRVPKRTVCRPSTLAKGEQGRVQIPGHLLVPLKFGNVGQLVVHHPHKVSVAGSSPAITTKDKYV